jgi:hypothetical protein
MVSQLGLARWRKRRCRMDGTRPQNITMHSYADFVNAALEHAFPILPPNEIVGCSIRELWGASACGFVMKCAPHTGTGGRFLR